MAAPKGNTYWQLAENPGRPRLYSPETLWEKAIEYFQWCEKHPWKEQVIHGKDSNLMELDKARAFTETGFRIFANMSIQTWENYHSGKDGYQDFLEVANRIREIIYTQKFEGAAAGFFNANIIARDLGLKEKTETEHTGKGGEPLTLQITVVDTNEGIETVSS